MVQNALEIQVTLARRTCGHAVPNVDISCLFRTRGKKAWGSESVNLGIDHLRASKSSIFGPRRTRAYCNPRGVLSVSSKNVLIRGVRTFQGHGFLDPKYVSFLASFMRTKLPRKNNPGKSANTNQSDNGLSKWRRRRATESRGTARATAIMDGKQ